MKGLRFFAIVALAGLTACATTKPPKNAATLRLHLPANPALPESHPITAVIRTPPLTLQVNSEPELTESDLDHAELTGEGDNFGLRLVFNTHGTILLDTLSLNSRGQVLVVFINGIPIAAPMLKQRIVDGMFEFTPDMTREVAEKVVKGLNATVKYLQKNSRH